MKEKKDPLVSDQTSLRKKAEAHLEKKSSKVYLLAPETDILKVIHELQVHQIELEMQNDELFLAKERAELAEKKYTDLYESAPSGYLTLSMKGIIQELNYSAAHLLHNEREYLIGKRLLLFISDNTRAIFNAFEQKLLLHKSKETCEVIIEKEGSLQSYVNIDGVLSKDGDAVLLSMVDITQSMQAEETLRQLEIEREALKFKQRFLANMSHEIRTPLTGVLGMVDILEHTKLNAVQRDYIHTLKTSGENLKMIINEVLDYSKIEAGEVKIVPSVFAFHSLFAKTKEQFAGRIKKGVDFSIEADPNIPGFVYADKNRIHQIISNLVANAIKFTHKGCILLRSKLLTTNPSSKHILIRVSVTDTGIGIPAEMQSKLFVPFLQIDDKDTREYEGTGLGLSICKELVSLLGGKIGVESEYHKGSAFWFVVPVQVAEAPKLQPEASQVHDFSIMNHKPAQESNKPQQNGKLRILFADDKQVNQKVISLILKSMGHEVTIACNGEEAINLFQPGKFDLILMDIQMPVMDGITATQKLKKEYNDIPPIVGLSASANNGDREKCLAMGMDDYLIKPVNMGDFKTLIARMR